MVKLPGYMGALEQCQIKLVPMPLGEWGEMFYDDQLIVISSRISLPDQLRTLLHECLHWRWPNRSEQQIVNLETTKWARLRPHELLALLVALYPGV